MFLRKKKRLWQRAQKLRASKNMGGHFSEKKKKRLRQRAQKIRASKNMKIIFLGKKTPAQRSQQLRASKSLGPFFNFFLSRNRLNRLLIYPIMVTKKSIWSKSHSGYCFRLPLA